MITFENVTKSYRLGNVALDNVSFEIKENEFVYFVGPSGAGKTSILKLILHMISPTSGSVMVDNEDISSRSYRKIPRLRKKTGVVFQDFKILPELNIFENVALSLKISGVPDRRIRSEVMEALSLVQLEGKELLFPVQLSAGEVQRVAIARAIIGDRKIILADEPTGNLDPKTTWEIVRIFKKLEGHKTILFATHNTDIVNSLRRRVISMKHGAIVKDTRKGGYDL